MIKLKTLLKFILLLVGGGIVGAASSLAIGALNNVVDINELLSQLSSIALANLLTIQLFIWLPSVVTILIYFMKAYKLSNCPNLSEEQEDYADKCLSISMGLSTLSLIFIFSTFSIAITRPTDINHLLLSAILFFISMCVSSSLEIASIKLSQKLHPEKKGDPLNFKFERDWLDSCDEGEKMITYVAGFKTAMLMKKIFIYTFTALILIGLFVNIGILPFILLGSLWGIFTLSYCIYSYKLEKGKLKY